MARQSLTSRRDAGFGLARELRRPRRRPCSFRRRLRPFCRMRRRAARAADLVARHRGLRRHSPVRRVSRCRRRTTSLRLAVAAICGRGARARVRRRRAAVRVRRDLPRDLAEHVSGSEAPLEIRPWRAALPDWRTRGSRPEQPTSRRGEEKRRISPTEAMKVAAVCTLTPARSSPQRPRPAQRLTAIRRRARRLAVEEVDLAQTALEGQPLVEPQLQRGEPAPAASPNRCTTANGRKVAAEHAMDLVLGARAGARRARVRLVSRRSVRLRFIGVDTSSTTRDERARERSRVEAIGLGLGVGDRPSLRVATISAPPWRCEIETIQSRPETWARPSATTSSGARL